MTWHLPLTHAHRISGSAGPLTFVGGVADFDDEGKIRHPDDLQEQVAGTIANLSNALELESCTVDDVVRLKVFYQSRTGSERWSLLASLANAFEQRPVPVITANPVPLQPWDGQALQVQAIALKGWRSLADVRSVTIDVPESAASQFTNPMLTQGLRAGEFISVSGQKALDDADEVAVADAIEQTHLVMKVLQSILADLGASLQDSIKKEGHYFGTTLEQWAAMAAVRASYFREPGPVATVVPCHLLWLEGLLTQVEVLAMRSVWNGFDKYIPREDRWPDRVWDWPIPLPYRQAIRLRDMIWTGGQAPSEPGSNSGKAIYPGDLLQQTRFTMSYIEDILRAFGATTSDLRLLVCYFTSDGSPAETCQFLEAVADCCAGPLPPITTVPQPHMHSEEMLVEIWGGGTGVGLLPSPRPSPASGRGRA